MNLASPRPARPCRDSRLWWLLPGGVILVGSVLVAQAWSDRKPPANDLWSLDARSLRAGIEDAAHYLMQASREDGGFVYRVSLDPKTSVTPRYNILRHAGTMYAIGMYLRTRPDDRRAAEVLVRSGEFLRRQIDPVPGQPDLRAVWSRSDVEHTGKPDEAKLGGTGLGLVALLALERVAPGSTPLEELRSLGRFLLYMQKEDGSSFSKFRPEHGGRDDTWTSLYYPGEAALGLVLLFEIDPRPEWLEGAARTIGFLARSRAGRLDVEVDHWALIASAQLLRHVDRVPLPVSREQILAHAIQQCEAIVRSQVLDPGQPESFGAFDSDGRTTPAATRLEGLLAALTIVPATEEALRARIAAAAGWGLEFLLRAQVRAGAHRGAMPRATMSLPDSAAKPSDARAAEVRIDYVQHAMSAMIQAEELREQTRVEARVR